MKSRYIIFADDDADDLDLITGFFKLYDRSINVLEFRDGKEVMQFLDGFAEKSISPQLIVLDINMPRMNGKDTLAAIRRHPLFQYIPVVIYTTSQNESDERFCKMLGASWMNKPSTLDGVRDTARILAEFCQLQGNV